MSLCKLLAPLWLFLSLCAAVAAQPMVYQPGMPYAVVIGDSIAEGEPGLMGRLNVHGEYKEDHPSAPGQLSYELAADMGVFHFNHGMGGQTSSQVRARWDRDALAQSVPVGDGRADRTLPAGSLPSTIFLHVGINDIAAAAPLALMQENFSYFARTTAERRIPLVVDNIGSWLGLNDEQIALVTQFNAWLATSLAVRYPNVFVIDYRAWSSGGTGDLRVLAPGKFADGVHPSKTGYADLARFVQESLRQPRGVPQQTSR